jgi:hypothetical protein
MPSTTSRLSRWQAIIGASLSVRAMMRKAKPDEQPTFAEGAGEGGGVDRNGEKRAVLVCPIMTSCREHIVNSMKNRGSAETRCRRSPLHPD